jgi:hypothetical protein
MKIMMASLLFPSVQQRLKKQTLFFQKKEKNYFFPEKKKKFFLRKNSFFSKVNVCVHVALELPCTDYMYVLVLSGAIDWSSCDLICSTLPRDDDSCGYSWLVSMDMLVLVSWFCTHHCQQLRTLETQINKKKKLVTLKVDCEKKVDFSCEKMTEATKRLHSEVNTEVDVAVKKEKKEVLVNKDTIHRLEAGTIIVKEADGYSFYVVDSFTKGGAPRCFQLKHEHVVTSAGMTEKHTVDKLVGERIEGAKPVVFRLTKNGLCSPDKRYSFYDEEIAYTRSLYWD